MKLQSFSVENYRSITQAHYLALSSSTILIGPNNEGKSNILRALHTAIYALSRYPAGPQPRVSPTTRRNEHTRAYDWKKDFPIPLQRTRTTKQTKIGLDFILDDGEVAEFKDEIKSNLNGILPVYITFSHDNSVDVRIVKQGRGSETLNKKGDKIAAFLARRIQFQYIPAVRTAQQAASIVEGVISTELRTLEDDPRFQAAMEAIRELQRPILNAFSERTTKTLQAFMPSMKAVTFSVSDERRYTALRQRIDITVDDGVITSLESKGDGIQSLVAMGLRRHVLQEAQGARSYIFLIEEPEAHLHPDAVHELREVLFDLAKTDQIVITSHSGILVNRHDMKSNIIVRASKAIAARNLKDIRGALGIRSHDNLINAELVLLVEGDTDKLALKAILCSHSNVLMSAFDHGRLTIESLDGVGALGARISLFVGILCNVHCFIDNDDAGRSALAAAQKVGLIGEADYNLPITPNRLDSEIEDMFSMETYKEVVKVRFGVDLEAIRSRNRKAKWSKRIEDAFEQSGKPFDSLTKMRIKFVVAEAVAANPKDAIVDHCRPIIEALVSSLEAKIAASAPA